MLLVLYNLTVMFIEPEVSAIQVTVEPEPESVALTVPLPQLLPVRRMRSEYSDDTWNV